MQSLQETWTGSARICRAGEMGPGQHTQYEAGSELTMVTMESLKQTVKVARNEVERRSLSYSDSPIT